MKKFSELSFKLRFQMIANLRVVMEPVVWNFISGNVWTKLFLEIERNTRPSVTESFSMQHSVYNIEFTKWNTNIKFILYNGTLIISFSEYFKNISQDCEKEKPWILTRCSQLLNLLRRAR